MKSKLKVLSPSENYKAVYRNDDDIFMNTLFNNYSQRESQHIASTGKYNIKLLLKHRGRPGLNRGPLDLQSNALPLSYIPSMQIN